MTYRRVSHPDWVPKPHPSAKHGHPWAKGPASNRTRSENICFPRKNTLFIECTLRTKLGRYCLYLLTHQYPCRSGTA